MELIEDWYEDSAYTFFKDKKIEEVNRLIEEYGSDQDVISHYLDKKYPETEFFVLMDYLDENTGYFRIRVWKK